MSWKSQELETPHLLLTHEPTRLETYDLPALLVRRFVVLCSQHLGSTSWMYVSALIKTQVPSSPRTLLFQLLVLPLGASHATWLVFPALDPSIL